MSKKRARLRAYYDIYYARMQALASGPEIKNYLAGKKAAAVGSLAQPARPSRVYAASQVPHVNWRPGLTISPGRAKACRAFDFR